MAKKTEPFHKKPRTTFPVLRKLQIQDLIDEEMHKMREERIVSRTHKRVLDMRSDYPDMPRFTVSKWNAVAAWAWDIEMETCAICRNHLMDACIMCQSLEPDAEKPANCSVAWGTCNHAFHLHCIATWLNTREVCPLDNKVWEFKRYGM